MNFTPMEARETRVYFANNIGGFDLLNIFVRKGTVPEVRDADISRATAVAGFIVTACNEHDQLKAEQARHRAELLSVVAKVAAAGMAMDEAEKVQGLLVAALKLAATALEHSKPIMSHYSDANKRHQEAHQAVLDALAAAGTPP